MTLLSTVILALAMSGATASEPGIATYAPLSDVVPHNKIDLSAFGMISALAGEEVVDITVNTDTQEMTKITSEGTHYLIAKDLYELGAGGSSSYVEYTLDDDGLSADFDEDDTSKYTCTQKDNIADGASTNEEFKIGEPKELYTKDGTTKVKVYMNHPGGMATTGCGTLPTPGATATTYTSPFSEVSEKTDDGDAGPGCPIFSDDLNSKVVECKVGNTVAVSFTFTAVKLGGRTLKGFSTGGAAKMESKNMQEYFDYKKMHGDDKNAETMHDEAIQLAFQGLIGSEAAFSSCEESNGNKQYTGVTEASCEDAAGTGYVFVQGNSLCKDKATMVANIPTGDDYAAQKTACTDAGGAVSEFYGREKELNIEIIQKLSIFGNAWMYAIYEFVDAIEDCNVGVINNNDAGVHAWDEGVAFYTGSLAGAHATLDEADKENGVMIYALADKRCQNYGTCAGEEKYEGVSTVNKNLFKLFNSGQFGCHIGDCDAAQEALDQIIPQMSVPLIQGTLRYSYKVGVLPGKDKEVGEGYAFMMAVVHRVHACNEADAYTIYEAMDLPPGEEQKLGGGHTHDDVKNAFRNNYACMGIVCADIGALVDKSNEVYPGEEECTDPAPAPAPVPDPLTAAPTAEVLPDWSIYVLAGGGGLVLILGIVALRLKAKKDKALKLYEDLKNERGNKA